MKKIILVVVCLLSSITVAWAQTECESMLESANTYYSEGNYVKAAKMYKMIQDQCDDNYGGIASKLKDCNRKLTEDADFEKCTTIEACDRYLSTYPNGRYVAQVHQKRSELKNYKLTAQKRAEEDTVFWNCTTEQACEEYLAAYPYGRYVSKVKAKLSELERIRLEEEAFADCTTELACEDYLNAYPQGKYYSQVLAKRDELEAERLLKEQEAAKTAYMKIQKIEFANADFDGNIIDLYGFTMCASEIKFLKPRITYNGILDDPKFVVLYCKIIAPNGMVQTNSISPSGYSFLNSFWVQPGYGNNYELKGWGSSQVGSFVTGKYKLEIWYEDMKIYQTSFTIKDEENALSIGKWRSALKKCNDYATQEFNNSSYKGQLWENSRSGMGMYYWEKGSCYIGNWRSGNQYGMGMYISCEENEIRNCPLGMYYVGEWSSDEKSGKGSCYDRYGNLIYRGTFADDWPTQTYPMTGNNTYKFECIEYPGGDCYIGETMDRKRDGRGVYIWSNGNMWYGSWLDDKKDGYGIYMPYQGEISIGVWESDVKL